MASQDGFSEIEKLLSLKGHSRGFKDDIVEKILNHDEANTPGCRVYFITSKKEKSWIEYKVLYKIKKYKDDTKYLSYVFECMSKSIKELNDLDITSIGVQEVYNSDPCSYYVLVYIIKEENINGRIRETEQDEYFDE